MYLFSRIMSSSLLATRNLMRSLLSTTKIMPSICSFSLLTVALDCQRSRYLDYPDISKTSKSTPQRVKVSFLKPMVGVMPLTVEPGSMRRARMVDLPALSKPISRRRAVEFPILRRMNNNNKYRFYRIVCRSKYSRERRTKQKWISRDPERIILEWKLYCLL